MSIRSGCFTPNLQVFFPTKFISAIQKFLQQHMANPLTVKTVGVMPLRIKGDYQRFNYLILKLIQISSLRDDENGMNQKAN